MSAVPSMGVVSSLAPKPADHAIQARWRWSVGGSGLAADAVAARADEVIVTSEVWMACSLPRDNPAAQLRAGDRGWYTSTGHPRDFAIGSGPDSGHTLRSRRRPTYPAGVPSRVINATNTPPHHACLGEGVSVFGCAIAAHRSASFGAWSAANAGSGSRASALQRTR